MIRPFSSLLWKILFWSFFNFALVGLVLVAFFVFHSQMSLASLFGQQTANRMRTAGMLISYDLSHHPKKEWGGILSRHSGISRVGFVLVDEDFKLYPSADIPVPETVLDKLRTLPAPGPKPPLEKGRPGADPGPPRNNGGAPPNFFIVDPLHAPPRPNSSDPPRSEPPGMPLDSPGHTVLQSPVRQKDNRVPPMPPALDNRGSYFMMRTRQPTRYWHGHRILLASESPKPPQSAVLLAVSDSVTGNGFFFDPLPWMMVAGGMIVISLLIWIPIVRNMTKPISKMMRVTDEIAKGNFDVVIPETRTDEIGRLSGAINHMAMRLSLLIKGQKRFLGDIAHELGSPISRIHFGLAILEEKVQARNKERVTDVLEDVEQMSMLVDELLAFSRAETGSSTVKLEKQVLLPIVREAVKRESRPDSKFIIDIDPGTPVVASAELLIRAVSNLIRNAFRYAGETKPVFITARENRDEVILRIRDYGPGVPKNCLPHLFEPFFRTDPSRGRDSGGVGLGLAIVKTCIETCKGSVSASNHEEKGLVVTITLKRAVS